MSGPGVLSEQVALVTGGGRGIGREIALACAAEGARVAVMSRSVEEVAETVRSIQSGGGVAIGVCTDVTDYEAVERTVGRVGEELGPLTILVNGAGSGSVLGPVSAVDPEAWWREVSTNLLGPFHACRAALPGMLARGAGRIVNITGAGTSKPFHHGSAYGSSKAALMRFTESLAAEVGEAGVRVFALSPGLVRTAMITRNYESGAYRRWNPALHELLEQGKVVPAEMAASLAVALASGRLDELHGRLFTVQDDLHELLARKERILREDLRTLRVADLD